MDQGGGGAARKPREASNDSGVRECEPKPVVLFLEDDEDSREAVAIALRAAHFEVHEASTIAEALALVPHVRPDVVIADRNVPDGDGFRDLVAPIRRGPHGAGVCCFIALTGGTSAEDIEAAVLSGCDVYLAKPITSEVVVARVSERITRRRGSA